MPPAESAILRSLNSRSTRDHSRSAAQLTILMGCTVIMTSTGASMDVKDMPEAEPRWMQITVPSTLPGHLELFRKSYGVFIELVERGSDMAYDFESVKREWQWWCGLERAYTQAGLNIIRLDRV